MRHHIPANIVCAEPMSSEERLMNAIDITAGNAGAQLFEQLV
ncbi:hypothetical protein [Trichocoleus sp. FACHB-262]|nr:hypothetical protein [Trichocoleus sp. FACHB-262]